MNQTFEELTKPGAIGTLAIKNRMLVAAMGVNLAEADGGCGKRITAYHKRQAEGGVGLVTIGVAGVAWPFGGNLPRQVAISDDKYIPGLRGVAEAVHEHGAKLSVQLHHAGLVAVQDAKEGRPIWVPSLPSKGRSDLGNAMLMEEMLAFHDPGSPPPQFHEMTQKDITWLINKFAEAADRAKKAGIDAVELHGAHGYIISGFLSPATNHRTDRYGGSLENRARLLIEIIAAVRKSVGPDFPLLVKLDSQEHGRAEGITLADSKAVAVMVEKAGVDAVAVTSYHDYNKGALHSQSNTPHLPDHMVVDASTIKQALKIPVICAGRIEPESAEKHIASGHFDFLSMGRKILADPDLPNKVVGGQSEHIRPCIYCYCCISQIYVMKPVKCAVNPETAREERLSIISTDKPRHIAVVGGGPGGMETARRLVLRGFRVTLLEESHRLGGTLQFASIPYEPNERLLKWLRLQVKQSSIDVRLNTRVTPQILASLGIEDVVVATGAKRIMPNIPGAEQDFVFSGEDMRSLVMSENNPALAPKTGAFTLALMRAAAVIGVTKLPGLLRMASKLWLPLGKRIVILGAELVGMELAEFLAERGRRVTLIDSANEVGRGLFLVRRMRLLAELENLGVTIIKNAQNINIGDHLVSYLNPVGQCRSIDADHVIVAQGATGDTIVADELSAAGIKVYQVGDCTGVTYIEGAIQDAAEVAAML